MANVDDQRTGDDQRTVDVDDQRTEDDQYTGDDQRTVGVDECSICLGLAVPPLVLVPCGHTFCDACWRAWAEVDAKCAMCRSPVTTSVVPVQARARTLARLTSDADRARDAAYVPNTSAAPDKHDCYTELMRGFRASGMMPYDMHARAAYFLHQLAQHAEQREAEARARARSEYVALDPNGGGGERTTQLNEAVERFEQEFRQFHEHQLASSSTAARVDALASTRRASVHRDNELTALLGAVPGAQPLSALLDARRDGDGQPIFEVFREQLGPVVHLSGGGTDGERTTLRGVGASVAHVNELFEGEDEAVATMDASIMAEVIAPALRASHEYQTALTREFPRSRMADWVRRARALDDEETMRGAALAVMREQALRSMLYDSPGAQLVYVPLHYEPASIHARSDDETIVRAGTNDDDDAEAGMEEVD